MKFPEAVLSNHVAVLGKTGSGKTSTAKLLVEHVVKHGDARVCVLDPIKSDWWGLTLASDGKRPGLPFRVLGGPYGHVPLHKAAGDAIGRVVASGALRHSIIDMADFGPGEQTTFFIAFAQSLFRHMTGVVFLVIEEAHMFAPKQQAGMGEEAKSIHWMNRIATGARSKGIRMVVCTHRVQTLHNSVLGSCETVIAHRLTLPADQKPVTDWLSGNIDKDRAKEITGSLSSLKTGEGWLCSGEAQIIERRKFPHITTYDNSATPTGDLVGKEVRPPTVDDVALKCIIGDAVKEAEANDPKILKRQIAELKKQIAARPEAPTPEPKIVEVSVLKEGQLARVEKIVHSTSGFIEKLTTAMTELGAVTKPTRAAGAKWITGPPDEKPAQIIPNLKTTRVPAAAKPVSDGDATIGKGERAILNAIAQTAGGVTREQLTVLTGYKRSSRDTYLQRLKAAELIDQSGETITATDTGVQFLGDDFQPLPTGHELRRHWIERLSGGEQTLFVAITQAYPYAISREELSEQTNYARSSRDTYLQRLSARKLITTTRDGVKASDELFD